MNRAQIQSALRLTYEAERRNTLSNGHTINGAIAWRQELIHNTVLLIGSNIENLRWYDRSICIVATIGPRGGIRIRDNGGVL